VAKLTNHHDYMDRLFKKGLLKRIAEGRAFRYSWKYSPEKPERAETFDGFRRLLGTSQAPFHLSHLVEVVGAQRFV
jgi:predicted transcriptional regulator